MRKVGASWVTSIGSIHLPAQAGPRLTAPPALLCSPRLAREGESTVERRARKPAAVRGVTFWRASIRACLPAFLHSCISASAASGLQSSWTDPARRDTVVPAMPTACATRRLTDLRSAEREPRVSLHTSTTPGQAERSSAAGKKPTHPPLFSGSTGPPLFIAGTTPRPRARPQLMYPSMAISARHRCVRESSQHGRCPQRSQPAP